MLMRKDESDLHALSFSDKHRIHHLGVIEVQFYRVNRVTHRAISQDTGNFKGVTTVPEKALKGKAISHGTKYDNEAQIIIFDH